MIKTKVVGLNNIYNFAVEDLFIWIRLGYQILISKLDKDNTGRINMVMGTTFFGVKWLVE
jgi:hypothetical protein